MRMLRIPGGRFIALLVAGVATTACDSNPTNLDELEAPPTVLVGTVERPSSSASDIEGIVVSVEGTEAQDQTDANGVFRVEARAVDGRIRLRFRGNGVDADVEIKGVAPGTLLALAIDLDATSATVSSGASDSLSEFEGEAQLVEITGATPERSLVVDLVSTARTTRALISESGTLFESDGDIVTFDRLVARVQSGRQVRIEGDGMRREDGTVVAALIKAETDEDDDENDEDDDDDEDFEGDVTSLTSTGDAPNRVVRLSLREDGTEFIVDIAEGVTEFDPEGDLFDVAGLLEAHARAVSIKVEGDGTLGEDGVFAAQTAKVETDDDDDQDQEEDFDGDLTSISVTGDAPERVARITLQDDDEQFAVDVVEGVTTFDSSGDIADLDALLAAHDRGDDIEVDGEGEQRDDGVFVARIIEVEIDD